MSPERLRLPPAPTTPSPSSALDALAAAPDTPAVPAAAADLLSRPPSALDQGGLDAVAALLVSL